MTDEPRDGAGPSEPALPGAAPRSADEAPKKRKWGCLGSPWALGCFGLFGIFLVAVLAVWILNGRDIDPPDVSDLEIALEPIPAEDNLLTYVSGGRGFVVPAGNEPKVDDDQLGHWVAVSAGQAADEETWDQAALEALIAANTAALADWESASNAPRMQVERLDFTAPIPGLMELRRLNNLVLARAELARRNGDHATALGYAMQSVQVGNKLQTGMGSLIMNMIGIATSSPALATVRHIVADPACPAEVCEEAATRLAALPERGPGLARAMRCEFTMATREFDKLSEPGGVSALTGTQMPAVFDRGPGFFFHPNRTKAMLAKDYRQLVADATKLPSQIAPAPGPRPRGGWATVKLILGGNAGGELLRTIVMPGFSRVIESRADGDAAFRCTQVLARVVAAHRRTGSRPATLAELYATAPADPFDGKPLRYDPAAGVIWSVGSDGVDGGGDLTTNHPRAAGDQTWSSSALDLGVRLPPK